MQVKLNDYNEQDFIKFMREWTNLSQKEFGKRIGKGERTIQAYESGEYCYNIATLKKICKEFNIEIFATKKSKY